MAKDNVIQAMMRKLPIGTVVRLCDDYPHNQHEIYGYRINADCAYIEFRDGNRLNLANIGQIREVIS